MTKGRAQTHKTLQGRSLDDLLPDCDKIDVHSVDVRRLRDDRMPIQVGEEVMFVAVAKFRLLTSPSGTQQLAAGDDVLEITDDADLVSPLEIEKEAAIADWVEKFYDFQFSIHGIDDNGTRRVDGDPPWVLRLDSSLVSSEYVRIEVEVVEKLPVCETDSALEVVRSVAFPVFQSSGGPAVLEWSVVGDRFEAGAEPEQFELELSAASGATVQLLLRVLPEGYKDQLVKNK